LKARDRDPDKSEAVCGALGARDCGTLIQRDTYFQARAGRLKLREETGASPHLIAYQRPDQAGERESRYRIVQVECPEELKVALSDALGIKAVVSKRRRLHVWEKVRIHLDDVEGLGSFIEFEAIAPPDSDLSKEQTKIETLRAEFGIREVDLVPGSYGDLIGGYPRSASRRPKISGRCVR
jgi:adenylate cyclase, class 2